MTATDAKTVWRLAAAGALLAVALAVCYLPLRHNGFVNFDDDQLILDNPALRDLSLESLDSIFDRQLFTPHYKPLVHLSWAAELSLFGPAPRVFHRHNLILHLLNTALVLTLVALLLPVEGPWHARLLGATAVAALWALHPMKVESVAWAAERKDVLFASFYLGAMVTYLRFADSRRRRWLALSAGLGLAAVLSKSAAITLPLALLLLDLFRGRRWSRTLLVEKAPHLAVTALALYLYGLLPGPGQAGSSLALLAGHDPAARLAALGHRHLAFAGHWLAPTDLAVLYPVPGFLSHPSWSRLALYALGHLALLGGLWVAIRRHRRVAAAMLFFSATLLPTLVAPISATNYLSDRYLYLPSLGLSALVVLAAAALIRRRPGLLPGLAVFAALICCILGLVTYRQVGVWSDSERLWTHTLETQPPNAIAYNNRGAAKRERGDEAGALADFDSALGVRPNYAAALANRGDLLRRAGKPELALADLDRAVALQPAHGGLYRRRGQIRAAAGDLAAAIDDYRRALELDPTDTDTLYLRAGAHRLQGDLGSAQADIDRTLALLDQPLAGTHLPRTHLLRALILAARGDLSGALADSSRAVELDPSNPVALNNRGFLRLRLDDAVGALADLDRALALRPSYPLALRSRGDALAALDRGEEACRAWRQARAAGAPAVEARLATCPPDKPKVPTDP